MKNEQIQKAVERTETEISNFRRELLTKEQLTQIEKLKIIRRAFQRLGQSVNRRDADCNCKIL